MTAGAAMRRVIIDVRPHWQELVEAKGMYYHTVDGQPYWDESAFYEFTPEEVDVLEAATYELDRLCLEAVQHVIDHDRFDALRIPREFRRYICDSWERDEPTMYGRFDLAYDGTHPPKVLEYNADTPTGLLEAAVIQWYWLQDRFAERSQFNSIHERLIEAWQTIRRESAGTMYFAALAGQVEDYMTVNYLRDTATQAGWRTEYIDIEKVGWHPRRHVFTDLHEHAIASCFKLYPWEWMFREKFGPMLLGDTVRWLEPPWKAILSNKAILAVLWELFPDHPNLLRTDFAPPPVGSYVQKPIFSREGANIQVFQQGRLRLATAGPYDGPSVYQDLRELPAFDGKYPCIGSWVVSGWACGIGIREDDTIITGNLSRFVPHAFGTR
jgi:glutathionylspermidine synthase